MAVLLSVVVPTYNRPESLQRCLQALLSQDLDNSLYEIIIVDGNPSKVTRSNIATNVRIQESLPMIKGDNTSLTEISESKSLDPLIQDLDEVSSWEVPGYPTLHYIPMVNNRGPAAARNIGWNAARGKIIAFTDDDCIPWPSWLSTGLRGINQGASGVSGQVIVPLPNKPTDMDLDAAEIERCEFSSANSFYTRESLDEVGGFDERFKLPWQEDRDLYLRMLNHKTRLSHVPTAIVVHPVNKSWWNFFFQARKSMYDALLFKKHRTIKHFPMLTESPIHHYLILLFLAVGLWSFFSGHMPAAIVSLAFWGLAIGRLAWLRLKDTSLTLQHISQIFITSLLLSPLLVFWRLIGALKFWVFYL